MANALKSTSECVSITDLNDNVIFLNKAFRDTYGLGEEDFNQKHLGFIRSP